MEMEFTEVSQVTEETKKPIKLTEIKITDNNVALNVMVGFLNLAQQRGVYSIDESSKIWECIQRFIVPNEQTSS